MTSLPRTLQAHEVQARNRRQRGRGVEAKACASLINVAGDTPVRSFGIHFAGLGDHGESLAVFEVTEGSISKNLSLGHLKRQCYIDVVVSEGMSNAAQ